MRGTLVNLNVNPCKMCMPMGAVTAFYGIEKTMSILHGSQGCSTYIRRHMATHYNEPVDIASSSLTEEGAVYGGEQNLLIGLKHLIQLYEPEVIGVMTTCLAETIGEDIIKTIGKFYNEYPEYRNIKIIPVSSPGYGGTQYEGYMRALYQVVRNVEMKPEQNHKKNIITSLLSPGDTRYLKELLESFDIDYILLPDLSETLDGIHKEHYEKLPSGGTSIEEISMMAGADFTIEITSFTKDNSLIPSVAEYLYHTYGVPYKKCNLPVGLRDNDSFLELLSQLSGKEISDKILRERGRFVDAMIDSHKYNGEARAVIYGEPDFVYSSVRLCVENGIMPMITATGTKCIELKDMVLHEIQEVADRYYIEEFEILDDVDFQTIEERARSLGVNILIGNSDGRRIAERLDVGLVRRSFPIHDRIGGQRLRTLGYIGALTFLDEIANVMIAKKETGFREELYQKHYNDSITGNKGFSKKRNMTEMKSIKDKTATHPCYSCGAAHEYARMHLPIAPKCNISCNYCVRKFDCPNESRPGVTTKVLTPLEAYHRYREVKKKLPKLSVVGIAGPGDALANFTETAETLRLIREQDKDITFCLSTNGLMLPQYANELVELGVSHVTVTMNAVDPKIGSQIYKHVSYMGNTYYGEVAAAMLMANQMAGIKILTSKGVVCKVNIVMIKGINDHHIPMVVQKVKELGATITNIMQLIPVQGSVFENIPIVSNKEIMSMRKKCGETLQQMYHCKQCRADAVGMLDSDRSHEVNEAAETEITNEMKNAVKNERKTEIKNEVKTEVKDNNLKLRVAIASKSGILVDQHFGQATELYVYEYYKDRVTFIEGRKIRKYCDGKEECDEAKLKFSMIWNAIKDCDAVIAMRIGEAPKQKLIESGMEIFTTYDKIEDSVKKIAEQIYSKRNK